MDAWSMSLAPGVRVLRRSAEEVQIGGEPGRAVVLPLTATVRRCLRALENGHDPGSADRELLADLRERGLVVARTRRSSRPVVEIRTAGGVDADLLGLMLGTGLERATEGNPPHAGLLVWSGEPQRASLDDWIRDRLPHLILRFVAGDALLGPFVVPGQTACLRCIDIHRSTDDPRWPVVLAQETTSTAQAARSEPADDLVTRMATAWAVADLRSQSLGRTPATLSTTIRLRPDLADTDVTTWTRHPTCGCR